MGELSVHNIIRQMERVELLNSIRTRLITCNQTPIEQSFVDYYVTQTRNPVVVVLTPNDPINLPPDLESCVILARVQETNVWLESATHAVFVLQNKREIATCPNVKNTFVLCDNQWYQVSKTHWLPLALCPLIHRNEKWVFIASSPAKLTPFMRAQMVCMLREL